MRFESEAPRDLPPAPQATVPSNFTIVDVLEGGQSFQLQHAVSQLESGNIIMFDNGYATRGFSRVAEFALDLDARVATLVWEYRPGAQYWGDYGGYAQALSSGNRLCMFNSAEHGSGVVNIWELTPEPGNATVVAHIQMDWIGSGMYRAMAFDSIYGEMPFTV